MVLVWNLRDTLSVPTSEDVPCICQCYKTLKGMLKIPTLQIGNVFQNNPTHAFSTPSGCKTEKDQLDCNMTSVFSLNF